MLDSNGDEIDIKQKFDEDEDIAEATAPSEFEEENVMTSMDGYTLDEGGEEGNMFDESLADEEAEDDYFDFDDFGNDEMQGGSTMIDNNVFDSIKSDLLP